MENPREQTLHGAQTFWMDKVIQTLGHLPVWGVVSTFAADSFYYGLTHREAEALAKREAAEPGRDAVVVLSVNAVKGPPMFQVNITGQQAQQFQQGHVKGSNPLTEHFQPIRPE